jgi:hypothetical protein
VLPARVGITARPAVVSASNWGVVQRVSGLTATRPSNIIVSGRASCPPLPPPPSPPMHLSLRMQPPRLAFGLLSGEAGADWTGLSLDYCRPWTTAAAAG